MSNIELGLENPTITGQGDTRKINVSPDRTDKIQRRIGDVLLLGKANTINPCHGCPRFNPETLCDDREKITLSPGGSLISPTGRVITILSGSK